MLWKKPSIIKIIDYNIVIDKSEKTSSLGKCTSAWPDVIKSGQSAWHRKVEWTASLVPLHQVITVVKMLYRIYTLFRVPTCPLNHAQFVAASELCLFQRIIEVFLTRMNSIVVVLMFSFDIYIYCIVPLLVSAVKIFRLGYLPGRLAWAVAA